MFAIPNCKRLTTEVALRQYATIYQSHSGLPVPLDYLMRPDNCVYGIRLRGKLIGGFILGRGRRLRTLEVFAGSEQRPRLYDQLGETTNCTEITCFWIDPAYRLRRGINTSVWLYLAFQLGWQEQPRILFGTCSQSLARLYGVTPKARLIHRDKVNEKPTFIFLGERQNWMGAFWDILRYKWGRMQQIRQKQVAQAT